MKRSEVWRQEYITRRYLKDCTDDQLDQRLKDILCNITDLNENGKIALLALGKGGSSWLEKFTHLQEEYKLRNREFPNIQDVYIPKPQCSSKFSGMEQLKSRNFLIKYRNFSYLEQALKEGLIRISPASSYNDPSLNHAIQDNELKKSRFFSSSEVTIRFRDESTGASSLSIRPRGFYKDSRESTTDYYVYCLSCMCSCRLFSDFEADSCLIINDPAIFTQILNKEFDKINPKWSNYDSRISYFDPFNDNTDDIDLFFSKNFRYTYQCEYRFVWVSPEAIVKLDPIFLKLGNLEHIANLITLNK